MAARLIYINDEEYIILAKYLDLNPDLDIMNLEHKISFRRIRNGEHMKITDYEWCSEDARL